jgi:hypothetical protein
MAGVAQVLSNFPDIRAEHFGFVPALSTSLSTFDPRNVKELVDPVTDNPYPIGSTPHSQIAYWDLANQPTHSFKVPNVGTTDAFQHKIAEIRETDLGGYPRNRGDVFSLDDGEGVGADWWERVHIFPKVLELGNVVSSLIFNIDLYSSFRRDNITLNDIDNQIVAQGVTVGGAPALPKQHQPQTSIPLTVSIAQVGPPNIDGDIVFDYDIRDIELAVTGTRVILFPYPPQRNVQETLSWKTDVQKSADGTEMRPSLRRFPRQVVEYEIIPRRDRDMSSIRSLFMEWQPRVFGIPLWWWARPLTVDASSGAFTVVVSDLTNMDLRVGGLCMVAKTDPNDLNEIVANVLEIDHLGSPTNTITFTTGLGNDFEVLNGAFITPVIPCVVDQSVDLQRARDGFAEWKMRFTCTENDSDVATADTSPFTIYQSKVVMDMHNIMEGSYKQTIRHKNTRVDFGIGLIQAFSTQLVGVSTHPLKVQHDTNQNEWEFRRLLYELRGQQKSFFLPTNQPDVELLSDAAAAATVINIKNIGFTDFIQNRAPIQDIQITLNDGTVNLHRITGSAIVSPGENLTISPGLAQDTDVADVKEICFVLQQRFATDDIKILHKWVSRDGLTVDSQTSAQTIGVPNG